MPGNYQGSGNRRSTYQQDQQAIWREIRKLWQKARPPNDRSTTPVYEVIFSYGGVVNPINDVYGQKWLAPVDGYINQIVLSLGQASGNDIEVSTLLNGSNRILGVLSAGSTLNVLNTAIPFVTGDVLQPIVGVTSDGTGQALGISYRYMRGRGSSGGVQ